MTIQQPEFLGSALEDGVLTLTLGGGKAHPLSRTMSGTLKAALDAAIADAAVKVIVIHGPGPIFCAGHDLKEISHHRADADHGQAFLQELFDHPRRHLWLWTPDDRFRRLQTHEPESIRQRVGEEVRHVGPLETAKRR